MANTKPIAADPDSEEFQEVYFTLRGLLDGLASSERWPSNVIIEATDQAVSDFEEEERIIEELKQSSAGRPR